MTLRTRLLVPFPLLALVIALAYLFGGAQRTASGSFTAARTVGRLVNHDQPMHVWGWMFFIGAFTLTVAMIVGNTRLIAGALFIGGMIYTWWAIQFAWSAVVDPKASLVGWALHGSIALGHYLATWFVLVDPLRTSR